MSNPITIEIPANFEGTARCVANAVFTQRVTLKWAIQEGATQEERVFSGAGEGVRMSTTNHNDTICKLTRSDNTAYNLDITFEFESGGNPKVFGPTKIYQNERLVKFVFSTEDGGEYADNDKNDTILVITSVAFDPDPNVASRIEEPPASLQE